MGRTPGANEQRLDSKKKKFGTKPDGVRNVGRPKLRWEHGDKQALRIFRS